MNHFFAYLFRMKYIKRWGLMRNAMEENLEEHTLEVALLAHALAAIPPRCIRRAMRSGTCRYGGHVPRCV